MALLDHRNTATTKKLDFKNSHLTSVGATTGVDFEIVLCGYNTIKMNSGDKFNVVISFEISA